MPQLDESDAAAEKAYAAAAQAVPAKAEAPVELPALTAKPAKPVPAAKIPVAPVEHKAPVVEIKAVAVQPKVVATGKAKPARKPVAAKKAAPVAKVAPVKIKSAPAVKTFATKATTTQTKPAKAALTTKETVMTKTTQFTEEFKTAAASIQAKATEAARDAYGKGSALFGETAEFTKGNVEAVVASGKVLATGLKAMGESFVADSKETIELAQAQAKQLAAVKSPTEFVQLQGELMKANFDKAVGYGSKNTEAFLKLANDVFAPISGRISLAVDKVRKAA